MGRREDTGTVTVSIKEKVCIENRCRGKTCKKDTNEEDESSEHRHL